MERRVERGQSSFIKPEASWRNVSVEDCSRRLKDELPAGALLPSLAEADRRLDRCRHDDHRRDSPRWSDRPDHLTVGLL
jgi:hypothetical protein